MTKKRVSISLLIASGLSSGYFPFASGTFGSLAALLFWRFIVWPMQFSSVEKLVCVVALCIVGVVSANIVLETNIAADAKNLTKKQLDPSYIVIDEWAGMWITLLAVQSANPLAWAVAFFLFRFFDVSKLGPIARAEKLKLGWGVMADDILAGIFSYLLLLALMYLSPAWLI